MRELEVVQKTCENNLADLLYGCFAQTDAETAEERTETIGVSFFATWSQTNGVSVVKAIWDELAWLLPFLRIVV